MERNALHLRRSPPHAHSLFLKFPIASRSMAAQTPSATPVPSTPCKSVTPKEAKRPHRRLPRPTSSSRVEWATGRDQQRDDLVAKLEELAAKMADDDRRLRLLEGSDVDAQWRREARDWGTWLNEKIERVAARVDAASHGPDGGELRARAEECCHKVDRYDPDQDGHRLDREHHGKARWHRLVCRGAL